MELLPGVIRASLERDPAHVMVNVREVECNDPSCSPIDTVIVFIFRNGRKAMKGIPAEMLAVSKADVISTCRR